MTVDADATFNVRYVPCPIVEVMLELGLKAVTLQAVLVLAAPVRSIFDHDGRVRGLSLRQLLEAVGPGLVVPRVHCAPRHPHSLSVCGRVPELLRLVGRAILGESRSAEVYRALASTLLVS
eukprot:SAG31_NODE_179_length_21090_cov_11.862871_5_plen_121_part_00